jgi:hypothetical protein
MHVANHDVYIDDVFRKGRTAFVSIAVGSRDTSVDVNGRMVRTIAALPLSADDFSGRMVIGDSSGQPDSWLGKLYGMAIYHRE